MLDRREIGTFLGLRLLAVCLFIFLEDRKIASLNLENLLAAVLCDVIVYLLLAKQVNKISRKFLWGYNPIVIYFILTSNGLSLLTFTLLASFTSAIIFYRNYVFSGLILALLCLINPFYLLSLPIVIVYGAGSPRYRRKLFILGIATVLTNISFLSILVSLLKFDFQKWIEKATINDVTLIIGGNTLSVTILIGILTLFWTYRIPRSSQNVFVIFILLSVTFIQFVQNGDPRNILIALPSIIIAVNLGTVRFIGVVFLLELIMLLDLLAYSIDRYKISATTSLFAYLTFLAIRIIRNGVITGDKYKFAAAPLSVAIAGDSGVGKDTFAQAITKPFGQEFTNIICGDDYHRFERGDDAWSSSTHLNPRMNNLTTWNNHLQNSLRRIPYEFQSYDHNSGKFQQGNISDSKDLVISQGLHALYPELVKQIDIAVYIEMDEDLRVEMKLNRDSKDRQQDVEQIRNRIKTRADDFQRYIAFQKNIADYNIKQWASNPTSLEPNIIELQSEKHLDVIRQLAGKFIEICGDSDLKFDTLYSGTIEIRTDNFTSDHVHKILAQELEDFSQMFPNYPSFDSGNLGIFQVLVFLHLDSLRKERLFLTHDAS
jgi:uridine kinase